MLSKIILLLLAAFPLMGSPGPATLSLASLGAAFGFQCCLRYLLGIIIGTTAVLLIIATGVTALISVQPVMLIVVQLVAAVYIIYLAWKIASAPIGPSDRHAKGRAIAGIPTFLPGIILAITNPKAFAAIGAVYSGHIIIPAQAGWDGAIKVAVLAAVIAVVNMTWLAFGATFSRFLTNPLIGRIINIVFAVLLLCSVGLALLGNQSFYR
jgi:threonine/homoserine/homoserine lactone efflux protein